MTTSLTAPSLPPAEELFELADEPYNPGTYACNSQLYNSLRSEFFELKLIIDSIPSHSLNGSSVYHYVDKLQSMRHDFFHTIVAAQLGVPAMERTYPDFLKDIYPGTYIPQDEALNRLTPDIWFRDLTKNTIFIIDVAVSVSPSIVAAYKTKKYDKLTEYVAKHMRHRGLSCKFVPVILDQNLTNLDLALLRVGKDLKAVRKNAIRLWTYECNNLIRKVSNEKLSDSSLERAKYYQLVNANKDDKKGQLVYPMPDLPENKEWMKSKWFQEAMQEFKPRNEDLTHSKWIATEFSKFYNDNPDKLEDNQLFRYPSEEVILDSITKMEDLASKEFNEINKPKPSLPFMIAESSRTHTTHDGKLDLIRVELLRQSLMSGFSTVGASTETTRNLHELLSRIGQEMVEFGSSKMTETHDIWTGLKKGVKGSRSTIKGKTTVSKSVLKDNKPFLKQWAGWGKVHKPEITKVDSLPFWDKRVRDRAELKIANEGPTLAKMRHQKSLKRPPVTGIPAIDTINTCQFNEVKEMSESILNCQASYFCKQISEMCQSILIQRKIEANNVQILNKGDRGFYVITLPHRLLETKKQGNTVPFFCICLSDGTGKLFNDEILECSFKCGNNLTMHVSRAMRLDVQRLDSLSHSYELFNSVLLGWMISLNDKVESRAELLSHPEAVSYLFYLCNSTHIRTGGLLDNLRYLFMDVTAEKSNFEAFMLDSGKIALKNTIQVALYSKIRKTLPMYSLQSKLIEKREPQYIVEEDRVDWGSLGVTNIKIPSIISTGYFFESFMAATNEIIGLFFAVPKDLHGEYHKRVSLEKTPFAWQCKFNKLKANVFLDKLDIKNLIESGKGEKQRFDPELVHDIGKHLNEKFLKVRLNEIHKEIGKLRLGDSILNHKQFTSSHSCIESVDEAGYVRRGKVLLTVMELIEKEFNGVPPSLWDFCLWAVTSGEPFRFAISPKGQRTMADREIYIGNVQSFALRLVEKVFSVICRFMPNESIHVAGDKKFVDMQSNFRSLLDWSRELTKLTAEKPRDKEFLREHEEKMRVRTELEAKAALVADPKLDYHHAHSIARSHQYISTEEEEIIHALLKGTAVDPEIIEKTVKDQSRFDEELECIRRRQNLQKPDFVPNVAFLNGDRTKWSAGDVARKFCIFIDALDSIPKDIRLMCKAILSKHDHKLMHVSESLHSKYMLSNMPSEFKEICGVEPFGMIEGNWFQGMLNYLSSCFHAAAQDLSWSLIRTKLLSKIPTQLIGMCHSDDEMAFIGYGTLTDDLECNKHGLSNLERNPLDTILAFHNIIGNASSMHYSEKKTNVHLKVSEFVSLFLIWGDQQFPYMKHLATAISGLPGTGLDDDMYAALSQLMMAAMRGCPMSCLTTTMQLTQDRIDRMYSLGKNMTNDVEAIFNIPRHFLPLEIGGTFLPGTLPLMLAGPAIHDITVIKAALDGKLGSKEMSDKVLKCFYALSPHGLVKAVADDDPLAQNEHYATMKLSGFTGMIFKNYLPKKVDKVLEKYVKEFSKEEETLFMLQRPAAAVMKPSDPIDSMKYWKFIVSKPSWIRAMRKEGARGMAIKRAQWVRSEHVKLRQDEDWRTLRDCLEEISAYVNDDSKKLGFTGRQILSDYVKNVSSSLNSILDYLSRIHVSPCSKPPKSVRIADFLNRPHSYRDVKNDIRKVIMYIWDKEAYVKENVSIKFPDFFAEDVSIVKHFYCPSFEKRGDDLKRFREAFRTARKWALYGKDLKTCMNHARSLVGISRISEKELIQFIRDVYSEASWVHKQFDDRYRTRIVLTAPSRTGLSSVERVISENCLRWSTLNVTAGVSMFKLSPTDTVQSADREMLEFKHMIHTLGYLYKQLLFIGVKLEAIAMIFEALTYEFKGSHVSLKDLVHIAVRFLLTIGEEEIQLKKLVAVMEANLYQRTNLANVLVTGYMRPLSSWKKSQTYDKFTNTYYGPFEYICWLGDNYLSVEGDDINNPEQCKWKMVQKDRVVAIDLLKKAYYDFYHKHDHTFKLLNPRVCSKSIDQLKFCRLGSSWTIDKPSRNSDYIPYINIEYNPYALTSSIEHRIFISRNGLELWQKTKFTDKQAKMITIKHTATHHQQVDKLQVSPLNIKKIEIDEVDICKAIELRLLPNILSGSMQSSPIEKMLAVLKPKKVKTNSINALWAEMDKVAEMPKKPIPPLFSDQDFPPLQTQAFLPEVEDPEWELLMQEMQKSSEPGASTLESAEAIAAKLWDLSGEETIYEIFDPEAEDPSLPKFETVQAKDEFMKGLHETHQLRGLVDPKLFRYAGIELFRDETTTMEYRSESSSSRSSGSTKITIKELMLSTKGGTFGEKMVRLNLCLAGDSCPQWIELAYKLLHYNAAREPLDFNKTYSMEALTFMWEILCEHVFSYGLSDLNTILALSKEDRILKFKQYYIEASRDPSKWFKEFDNSTIETLLDCTYTSTKDVFARFK